MNRSRLALAVTVLALALSASACRSDADGADGGPDLTASGDPGHIALTIDDVSAWQNLHVSRAPSLPQLVVRGDGSFHASAYDGGETVLHRGTLTPEQLDDLLDAAVALPRSGYGQPGLDGSTTTIALGEGSGVTGTREVSVWVPGELDAYDGRARENRVAFNEVLELADTLARTSGDVWTPDAWFLLSEDDRPHPDDPTPPPWPVGGVDPEGTVIEGMGCQVVSAEDADRVRAAQDAEDPDVHGWTHAGTVYDVLLLPVLPEVACDDLRPYVYPAG